MTHSPRLTKRCKFCIFLTLLRENQIFSKVQSTYGVSFSRKIYINGRQEKDSPLEDIWSPLIPRYQLFRRPISQNSVKIGGLLSKDDISFLTIAVEGWVTYGVIPFLEKKIKKINTEVLMKITQSLDCNS
jgi:hypothetical protein